MRRRTVRRERRRQALVGAAARSPQVFLPGRGWRCGCGPPQ
ncbi:hypothetical protein ACFOPN_20225 [Xanthomonas hyacinthi]